MNDSSRRKIGKYDAEIFWSDEDGGFIGIVPSLPGCSAFGETEDEAKYELYSAIAAWLEARAALAEKEPPE